MRISYKTVKTWLLADRGCSCTAGELRELHRIVGHLLAEAEQEEAEAKKVVDEAEGLVKKAEALVASRLGVNLAQARAKLRNGGALTLGGEQSNELASGKRRPYLNPLDAQSPAYGKFNQQPTWLTQLQARYGEDKITLQHCRADRLAETAERLGMALPWPDPVAYHTDVLAKEGLRRRRKPSVKKS